MSTALAMHTHTQIEQRKTIWDVEQTWMPGIRTMCLNAEAQGKPVTRLTSLKELDALMQAMT